MDQSAGAPGSQSLVLPFCVPGRSPAYVKVAVEADCNPQEYGLDLLFPTASHQPDDFVGFPLCHATVHSPVSRGYASLYGWIQLVKNTAQGNWELDPLPINQGLDTPFTWFGPEPQLFDAPLRVGISNLDWTARSFLVYIDDFLMSKAIGPILSFE
ncbi:hypothetical protein FQN53_009593 [Emmonsiellopsis sp. PD_33]|nr:hypothetical protein FQN53_009593 [Emmonsiellopsis sp. PD_33]KAK2807115.1 hypothetical protein FQN51_004729 [Onygenales sp. PD_10]